MGALRGQVNPLINSVNKGQLRRQTWYNTCIYVIYLTLFFWVLCARSVLWLKHKALGHFSEKHL